MVYINCTAIDAFSYIIIIAFSSKMRAPHRRASEKCFIYIQDNFAYEITNTIMCVYCISIYMKMNIIEKYLTYAYIRYTRSSISYDHRIVVRQNIYRLRLYKKK